MLASTTAARTTAGRKGRRPCVTTTPHQPALWCLLGLRPLPCTPERSLSILEACTGPQERAGRPKDERCFHFSTSRYEGEQYDGAPGYADQYGDQHDSGLEVPSTLFEDTAPSAFLGHLKAQAAPTHP